MAEYDGLRTLFLQKRGIDIVRIANELLARDSWMVERMIDDAIVRRSESR